MTESLLNEQVKLENLLSKYYPQKIVDLFVKLCEMDNYLVGDMNKLKLIPLLYHYYMGGDCNESDWFKSENISGTIIDQNDNKYQILGFTELNGMINDNVNDSNNNVKLNVIDSIYTDYNLYTFNIIGLKHLQEIINIAHNNLINFGTWSYFSNNDIYENWYNKSVHINIFNIRMHEDNDKIEIYNYNVGNYQLLSINNGNVTNHITFNVKNKIGNYYENKKGNIDTTIQHIQFNIKKTKHPTYIIVKANYLDLNKQITEITTEITEISSDDLKYKISKLDNDKKNGDQIIVIKIDKKRNIHGPLSTKFDKFNLQNVFDTDMPLENIIITNNNRSIKRIDLLPLNPKIYEGDGLLKIQKIEPNYDQKSININIVNFFIDILNENLKDSHIFNVDTFQEEVIEKHKTKDKLFIPIKYIKDSYFTDVVKYCWGLIEIDMTNKTIISYDSTYNNDKHKDTRTKKSKKLNKFGEFKQYSHRQTITDKDHYDSGVFMFLNIINLYYKNIPYKPLDSKTDVITTDVNKFRERICLSILNKEFV
jgi:hypothetical protein